MSAGLVFYTDADKRVTQLEQQLRQVEHQLYEAFKAGFVFGRDVGIDDFNVAYEAYKGNLCLLKWGIKPC